jgi:hypothetical protein
MIAAMAIWLPSIASRSSRARLLKFSARRIRPSRIVMA